MPLRFDGQKTVYSSHSTLLSRDHWIDGWMDGCPCVLMAKKRCILHSRHYCIGTIGWMDGWMDGCPCVLMAKKRCILHTRHYCIGTIGWMNGWMPLCFNWRSGCLIKLDIVCKTCYILHIF